MLRKEEFPKEPIEILKDVLPSEVTRQDFVLYAKNIRSNAIHLISWLKHSNGILEPAGSCYENESG